MDSKDRMNHFRLRIHREIMHQYRAISKRPRSYKGAIAISYHE